MTPLPNIDGVWRCALRWNNNGVTNVIHVHNPDATPAAVGAAIAAGVNHDMWGVVLSSRTITHIDITPLFEEGSTFTYNTDGTSKWQGENTGDEIPAGAAVVSLHTALRGRSNRGRVFIGPVAEAAQTNGTILASDVTGMVTAWDNFSASLITNDFQFVVASYKKLTALTVVATSVRPQMGTMRRRQSRLAA